MHSVLDTIFKSTFDCFFDVFLMDFWKRARANLAPKSDPESILSLNRSNQLNISPLAFTLLSGFEDGKNQPKHGTENETHLDIEF